MMVANRMQRKADPQLSFSPSKKSQNECGYVSSLDTRLQSHCHISSFVKFNDKGFEGSVKKKLLPIRFNSSRCFERSARFIQNDFGNVGGGKF